MHNFQPLPGISVDEAWKRRDQYVEYKKEFEKFLERKIVGRTVKSHCQKLLDCVPLLNETDHRALYVGLSSILNNTFVPQAQIVTRNKVLSTFHQWYQEPTTISPGHVPVVVEALKSVISSRVRFYSQFFNEADARGNPPQEEYTQERREHMIKMIALKQIEFLKGEVFLTIPIPPIQQEYPEIVQASNRHLADIDEQIRAILNQIRAILNQTQSPEENEEFELPPFALLELPQNANGGLQPTQAPALIPIHNQNDEVFDEELQDYESSGETETEYSDTEPGQISNQQEVIEISDSDEDLPPVPDLIPEED